MTTVTVYGIKSCSTMKKAFTKLDELNISYEFHDYKKLGIDEQKLRLWVDKLGIEKVLNKRGTTWRKLTEEEKSRADEEQGFAIELLAKHTSMIKRPIVESDESLLCGYDESEFDNQFS